MEKIFSKCGMRCDLCLVYRPNVEKEDRRTEICNVWKKIWKGYDPDPKTVICDGCCCEREGAVRFSPLCETRKCVVEKGLIHCGYCEKYPCDIFPAEPTQKETIQKIEVEKQWTWDDEKLMEAYACKKNMDEFRSKSFNIPNLRNMTSIYLRREDKFLLLYRVGSKVIGNSYTGTAGGHFESEELNDARSCVLRELKEETGLTEADIKGLSMRYVTLRLKNGEIRQNYYFFATLAEHVTEVCSNEGELRWFDASELAGIPMPHSAKYMLLHYLKIGQYTDCLYGGITTEAGVEFTELKEF